MVFAVVMIGVNGWMENFFSQGMALPDMLKAAAIQMDCIVGDRKSNLAKAEKFILEAIVAGSKLIVLPELFSTGAYDLGKEDHSELLYHRTTKFLIKLSTDHEVIVTSSPP